MTGELWKPIVGYEGSYEISSLGNVRSLPRVVLKSNGIKSPFPGKTLKPGLGSHGYLTVSLNRQSQSTRTVHSLVAEAFLGARPSIDHEVCHIDGNPLHNSADNLRWDTRPGNVADSLLHGTHAQTNKTHCPAGHAYSEENTRLYQGRRYCRACHNIASRKRYRKLRSKVAAEN